MSPVIKLKKHMYILYVLCRTRIRTSHLNCLFRLSWHHTDPVVGVKGDVCVTKEQKYVDIIYPALMRKLTISPPPDSAKYRTCYGTVTLFNLPVYSLYFSGSVIHKYEARGQWMICIVPPIPRVSVAWSVADTSKQCYASCYKSTVS